ncbi:alpha-ketoglutarate-dependent dioxygenase AlkB [Robiginitalea sp. SC105]|uniref:alpha-ketoglutarate-dependent dioxygenase AlkB family protein n=1 Tax=Robiginitalea sp. SC105 TaxID=2762332 RepID=UPI00163A96F0|nr:alpha-ketoglutarate-dependent dioxygenase AlkB [Robiginitalea sp. SC105]MBC2839165.1 alpha-ketoglutarate-dependent dioxygenase AlkB [Robiginitalea sp. SC105]
MKSTLPELEELPDATIRYQAGFLDAEKAGACFETLYRDTPWRQDPIRIFGKTYPQPRLTALYGNNGKSYSYSGIEMQPHPFTPLLQELLEKVSGATGQEYTTCLLNLYRDGSDSNGWHADNEPELGQNPAIASLSLGSPRIFHLKHRQRKDLRVRLLLEPGSLLLMAGATQHHWLHQLPKTRRPIGPRINLTFRKIY